MFFQKTSSQTAVSNSLPSKASVKDSISVSFSLQVTTLNLMAWHWDSIRKLGGSWELTSTTTNRTGASNFPGLNMCRTPSFICPQASPHSTMCWGTNLHFSHGLVNLPVCQLWIICMRLSKCTWEADHICLQRASQWQKRLSDWWRCPHQALQPGQKVWLSTETSYWNYYFES